MKTKIAFGTAASVCSLILTVQSGFAQGSLTPSGPPGPTMLTLSQIEPRTIVNAANTPGDSGDTFIISQPGSYYMTTNLIGVSGQNGITITANNVTLDLNGFALQGVSGSGIGIYIMNARTDITVRNGTVNGWGTEGVFGDSMYNLVIDRLNVSSNQFGIYFNAGVVRDCTCESNLYDGIDCDGGVISGCALVNNGESGLNLYNCTVSGCTAYNNGDEGFYIGNSTVSGCTAGYNSGNGIATDGGSLVSDCTSYYNKNAGVAVYANSCAVIGNNCFGNNPEGSSSSAGIYVEGSENRIEDNHVTGNGYAGIQVYNYSGFSDNIIIKNSVFGDGANNYVTPGTQIVGPIITATGTISSTSPWANFSF